MSTDGTSLYIADSVVYRGGKVYVADSGMWLLRSVDTSTGNTTTLAGHYTAPFGAAGSSDSSDG